jgi:tetratricopeptide (TPR) repeat protein
MDIWRWVGRTVESLREAGHDELAGLVYQVPEWVCDDDHARAESGVVRALELAKPLRNPWLEVYFKHWLLQSRVLHRLEVGPSLREAVALMELATRPEAQGCPQSICATQDLVNCYAGVDGPGYAPERLAATRQTLDRIDPSWACWECISAEHADALLDDGRPAEALEFLQAQVAARIAAVGDRGASDQLALQRTDTLLALGRPEEAWEVLQTAPRPDSVHRATWFAIKEAFVLCVLGRHEEAVEHLPAPSAIWGTPTHYEEWQRPAVAIDNDWRLDRFLCELQGALTANGATRPAMETALRRGRLAVGRGRPGVAADRLAEAEALARELVRPLDAPALVATLRADIDACDALEAPLPVSPEAAIEVAGEDPEGALPVLQAARGRWADHAGLLCQTATALDELGRLPEARAALEAWLDAGDRPDGDDRRTVMGAWYDLVRRAPDDAVWDRLDAEIARADDEAARRVRRGAAHMAWSAGDLDRARALLAPAVDEAPHDAMLVGLYAAILSDAGEHEEALGLLNAVAAHNPPGPWDDDRLVLATRLGRPDVLADAAARVGDALDGGGDLLVVVRRDAEGANLRLARRTGPASARLATIDPRTPDDLHDELLFDPTPLRQAVPEDQLPQVHEIERLRPGGWRAFPLEGVHPGESLLKTLEEALGAGCMLRDCSAETYRVTDADGASQPGLYAWLAVAPDVDLSTVLTRLVETTAALEGPVVAPILATAAGDADRASAWYAAARAHGVDPD